MTGRDDLLRILQTGLHACTREVSFARWRLQNSCTIHAGRPSSLAVERLLTRTRALLFAMETYQEVLTHDRDL